MLRPYCVLCSELKPRPNKRISITISTRMMMNKVYDITDAKGAADNIADLKRWGDPDTWKLIAKASSDDGEWMKSTKAMQIDGVGVVIQVTEQQNKQVAEALTFVP